MAGWAAISRVLVTPRLVRLREAMGALDRVAPDDPRRAAFGQLHGVSVALMLLTLAMGVAAILLGPSPATRSDASVAAPPIP